MGGEDNSRSRAEDAAPTGGGVVGGVQPTAATYMRIPDRNGEFLRPSVR